MIDDYDNWSDSERLIAENHITTCKLIFERGLTHLATLEVELAPDKRAAIEIVALLECAAKLAREHLNLSADDFGVTACDVYMRRG